MRDTYAAVTEALEARVRDAEGAGLWAAYDLAYTAYAAWVMGDDPLGALRSALGSLPRSLGDDEAAALRTLARSIEAAVTEALSK